MRQNLYAYVMGNLDARRVTLARVSREAGVPYESLKKIAHRRTPNPGVKHVQALAEFFDRLELANPDRNQPSAQTHKAHAAINFEARCQAQEVAHG